MSRERWGTFSVMDHQRPGAFVSEVLLYDRLIIPVPANGDERKRWTGLGWKPEELDNDLKILGDKAIKVPWDEGKHKAFKTVYEAARDAGFDVQNLGQARQNNTDPLYVTRHLLAHDFLPELPKGVAKVWAMAAYPSFNRYEEDMATGTKDNFTSGEMRKENLVMAMSHQFLVPADKGKSRAQLLKKAINLSAQDDFIKNRNEFYKWQEDIIEQGITDKKAIEEMEQYLGKYNAVVKKASNEVRTKFGLLLVKIGIGLPGIIIGQVEPILSGLIDIFSYAKFERKLNIDAGDCGAAAMIYDAQKKIMK